VSWEFLNAPVDFQTTYFVVFGAGAVYGLIMLVLARLDDRRKRDASHAGQRSRTNS
jgi:hypothetical protein